MRYLYTIALSMAMPLILLRLLWRARRVPGYAKRWSERFGYINPPTLQNPLWVHAVSVGEVIAAIPLVKHFLQYNLNASVVITTMTPSGSDRVKAAFGDKVFHVYAPYDLPSAVKRFLKHVKPRLLVLIETELWPNMLALSKQAGIPVFLANGRLSEYSASGYKRLGDLTKEMLTNVTLLAAQGKSDAERFLTLGFDPRRLHITGSIKFDLEIPADLHDKGKALRKQWGEQRLVWIAASTHSGEEEQVLSMFGQLKKTLPDLLLLLVPRHPDRFSKVASLCRKHGYKLGLRSEQTHDPNIDIFLGDSMGELLLFYAAADVAFVGGSLVSVGGHNVLEPAALGIPVVTGNYLFNFAEISQQMQIAQAMWAFADLDQITNKTLELLQDANLRQTTGKKGQQVVMQHKGSLAKQYQLMMSIY